MGKDLELGMVYQFLPNLNFIELHLKLGLLLQIPPLTFKTDANLKFWRSNLMTQFCALIKHFFFSKT